jgi:hypothetical protein
MLNIMTSNRVEANGAFKEDPRQRGEDNIEWLQRTLPADPQRTYLVLLGGVEPYAFRLRVAQSHVRHDLTPSHWSHAALLDRSAALAPDTVLYEISLQPAINFGFPPPSNAVQRGELRTYRKRELYPNIAVLGVPAKPEEVLAALAKFERQRAIIDGPDLLLRWLSYVWGVGSASNPLIDGYGVPSAAMIEVIIGAAGFDLTPALENRSSCPEAIWQSARWWHGAAEGGQNNPTPEQEGASLVGAWSTEHYLMPDLSRKAKRQHPEPARAEAAQSAEGAAQAAAAQPQASAKKKAAAAKKKAGAKKKA